MAITYLSGKRIQGSSAPLGDISKANLKAYFTLDEASGDLLNTASAIGSTHAISSFNLSTTTATRNQTGKVNKALSFPSSSIATADDSTLADTDFLTDSGAVWTICFWVKLDTRVGDQAFICTTDSGAGDNGLLFRTSDSSGHLNIFIGTNGDDRIEATSSAAAIPDTGNWHFVMCQYDNSTGNIKMSVDDGAVETVHSGGNLTNTDTPSDKLVIGDQVTGGNDLDGDLDEMSIWNRILTTAEITAIYDANNSGDNLSTVQTAGADEKTLVTDVPVGSEFEQTNNYKTYQMGEILVSGANLKAYWKFDEASGTTANNDAGNVADNSGATLGTDALLTLTDVDLAETGSPTNLGTSALFDGTDSYGVTPTSTESNFNFFHQGSSWTVCYWYRSTASFTSNQHVIDNKGAADGAGTYGLDIRTNPTYRFRANLSNNGFICNAVSSDDFVPDSTDFHHYALTWNDDTEKMTWFRDGGNKEETTGSAGGGGSTDANDDLAVSSYSNALGSGVLKGNLLELAIFERVLTDAEIIKIYNDGDGLQLDTGVKVWKERGTAI